MADLPIISASLAPFSGSDDVYFEFYQGQDHEISVKFNVDYRVSTSATFITSSVIPTPVLGVQSVGMSWADNGSKLYVLTDLGDTVYQFDFSTPYDLSTMVLGTGTLNISGESSTRGLHVTNDGRYLYAVGLASDVVRQYEMSTPYLLTSATQIDTFSVNGQTNEVASLTVTQDGKWFYVNSRNGTTMFSYEMLVPFDLTTAVYRSSRSNTVANDVDELTISKDGKHLYAVDNLDTIHHFSSSIGGTLSNFSDQSGLDTLVLSNQNDTEGMDFFIDDSGFSVIDTTQNNVANYSLTTSSIEITNVPSDFVSMTTLGFEVEASLSQSVSYDIYDLYIRVLSSSLDTVLAGASSTLASSWATVTSSMSNVTDVVYSGSFSYVNTTAPSGSWNDCVVQFKQTYATGSGIPTGQDFGIATGASPTNASNNTYLSFTADTTEVQSTALTHTSFPSAFYSMEDGLTFNVEYNVFNWSDDDYDLSIRITNGGVILAANGAGGGYQDVALNISNGSDVATGAITFNYVNNSATKTDWENANIQLQQTYTKSKGGDSAYIRIDYVEISGSYAEGDDGTFIRLDNFTFNGTYSNGAGGLNLSWNGITWSNIANLDGVTAANIASVDGIS